MKLVVEERESRALRTHLGSGQQLVASRIALVEVTRAVRVASPGRAALRDAGLLLASCWLVEVGEAVLRAAAGLASARVRTIDAIHLATALRVAPDEVVAYDGRLAEAMQAAGLPVASPGAG